MLAPFPALLAFAGTLAPVVASACGTTALPARILARRALLPSTSLHPAALRAVTLRAVTLHAVAHRLLGLARTAVGPRIEARAVAASLALVLAHALGEALPQHRAHPGGELAAGLALAGSRSLRTQALRRVGAGTVVAKLLKALAQGFEALLEALHLVALGDLRAVVAATGAFGTAVLGRQQGGEEGQDQQ